MGPTRRRLSESHASVLFAHNRRSGRNGGSREEAGKSMKKRMIAVAALAVGAAFAEEAERKAEREEKSGAPLICGFGITVNF